MAQKHILVVEDNAATRTLIQHTLEFDGYRVTCAADGAQALAKLTTGPVDLIVLDVMMPDVDGFSLLSRIRADQMTYELPVLMLSALDDADSTWKGWQGGCNYYMNKPFDPETLTAIVGSLIAGTAA